MLPSIGFVVTGLKVCGGCSSCSIEAGLKEALDGLRTSA